MAGLPGWMKIIETKDKGATVVIVIRWWHPHVWRILWKHCNEMLMAAGHNPNHLAIRWTVLKTVTKTVWRKSKHSWLFVTDKSTSQT